MFRIWPLEDTKKMLSIKEPEIKVLNENGSASICHKSAVDISKDLQKLMLRLKGDMMSEDGRYVNYKAFKESKLFAEYTKKTYDLLSLNLLDLSHEEKVAFFINIYNALTIHGLVEQKSLPGSVLDVRQFWKVTSYRIGQHVFSLDDIEHGVLRGNRPHPSSRQLPFAKDDKRLAFSVTKLDPRVHFALVCAAKSCPAIRVYSADKLDSQLDAATRAFCAQEVRVYEIQRRLSLSQIFQWYYSDFGANDVEAIRWTLPYLDNDLNKALRSVLYLLENEGMVDIEYKEYDWKLNLLETPANPH